MQEEIHHAEPGDTVHQFVARQSLVLQVLLLVSVKGVVLCDVLVCDQQEPASTAGVDDVVAGDRDAAGFKLPAFFCRSS